jgi:hypothetical protein
MQHTYHGGQLRGRESRNQITIVNTKRSLSHPPASLLAPPRAMVCAKCEKVGWLQSFLSILISNISETLQTCRSRSLQISVFEHQIRRPKSGREQASQTACWCQSRFWVDRSLSGVYFSLNSFSTMADGDHSPIRASVRIASNQRRRTLPSIAMVSFLSLSEYRLSPSYLHFALAQAAPIRKGSVRCAGNKSLTQRDTSCQPSDPPSE